MRQKQPRGRAQGEQLPAGKFMELLTTYYAGLLELAQAQALEHRGHSAGASSCVLFHTQEQIAAQLGMPPAAVAGMLLRLKHAGVVRFWDGAPIVKYPPAMQWGGEIPPLAELRQFLEQQAQAVDVDQGEQLQTDMQQAQELAAQTLSAAAEQAWEQAQRGGPWSSPAVEELKRYTIYLEQQRRPRRRQR